MSFTSDDAKRIFYEGRHSKLTFVIEKQKVLLLPEHIHCPQCQGTCIIDGKATAQELRCPQCLGRGQIKSVKEKE